MCDMDRVKFSQLSVSAPLRAVAEFDIRVVARVYCATWEKA